MLFHLYLYSSLFSPRFDLGVRYQCLFLFDDQLPNSLFDSKSFSKNNHVNLHRIEWIDEFTWTLQQFQYFSGWKDSQLMNRLRIIRNPMKHLLHFNIRQRICHSNEFLLWQLSDRIFEWIIVRIRNWKDDDVSSIFIQQLIITNKKHLHHPSIFD